MKDFSSSLKKLWKEIRKYKYMYLLALPALIWFFIFQYMPMYGLTLAFKEFRFDTPLWSLRNWVGTKYLVQFFNYYDFWNVLKNTLVISTMKLVFGFPAPIILALMLNEVRIRKFKRAVQTVSYFPYFISWVVAITLFTRFFSIHGGIINDIKIALYGGEPVYFLGQVGWFYFMVVFTEIWKGCGWGSIIYLSALTSINPQLYEASKIDGAGRMRRIWHISIPGIMPTIGVLFILAMGNIMKAGYEQIILLYNPSVAQVAEILDTYIIRMGLKQGRYSYATAAGLFLSVVSFILVATTNWLSKKTAEVSIW